MKRKVPEHPKHLREVPSDMGAKRILWAGIFLFVVFVAICALTHGTAIPVQLAEQANDLVMERGETSVEVRFEGQHALLTGTVADSSSVERLVALLEDLPGVVTVTHVLQVDTEHQTSLADTTARPQ